MQTSEVVAERGMVSEYTKENFLEAGFAPEAMMEVLVGVALKTISNDLDHFNSTTIDAAFSGET